MAICAMKNTRRDVFMTNSTEMGSKQVKVLLEREREMVMMMVMMVMVLFFLLLCVM